jgi:protein involved in polysaccharide export with SLBB domain
MSEVHHASMNKLKRIACSLMLALCGSSAIAQLNLPQNATQAATTNDSAAGITATTAASTTQSFRMDANPSSMSNSSNTLLQRNVPDAGALRNDKSDSPISRDLPALELTEYQRFLQATTGRNLPLYGYDLFTANTFFPSLKNVPVPADYVLGPGDELDLRLWGAVDADLKLNVDRNGQINIPRVGTVNVAGVKASQLDGILRARISRLYNNFQLNVTVGQLRSIQIYVVGRARKPGAYMVSSLSTLINTLFESGGPSATGSMRNIQLRRDGVIVSTLDLYRFINEGDKTSDVKLQPGDVIVIPPAGPRVAITGALDNPAIYELASNEEQLGKILSYGGRTAALTSVHKVLVERINSGSDKAPRSVDERALDTKGLQSTVRDGDIVTLFKISPEFSNAVTLRGNVSRPLRYIYKTGMRISDLIPDRDALIQPDYYTRRNLLVQYESGRQISGARILNEVKNLLEEINWDYAVVERLDAKEIRSQLIPFNLGLAVRDKDPSANIELLPGDIVTIFGVNDLAVPLEKRTQYIRISGEVKVPGVYQIKPGETLDQVMLRAGGLAQNAYPYATVFLRESVRLQQQANLDIAIRRLEAETNSQNIAALQNNRAGDKAGEFLQAQIANQRALLANLQSQRVTGRIALEMNPQNPVFPPVLLQDGDQITVPYQPSFISVFGAVTAETSLLHRANYSVREYLERSAPTADADTTSVVIIRADGTTETNSTFNQSLFSSGNNTIDKKLNPGDSVYVPQLLDKRSGYTKFVEGVKDWTTILYQFGLGAAGLKVLKN